eukprot:scaffold62680_cov53-Phaeocystis_antarctica.AAC.2
MRTLTLTPTSVAARLRPAAATAAGGGACGCRCSRAQRRPAGARAARRSPCLGPRARAAAATRHRAEAFRPACVHEERQNGKCREATMPTDRQTDRETHDVSPGGQHALFTGAEANLTLRVPPC